jgi:hypothetical protein
VADDLAKRGRLKRRGGAVKENAANALACGSARRQNPEHFARGDAPEFMRLEHTNRNEWDTRERGGGRRVVMENADEAVITRASGTVMRGESIQVLGQQTRFELVRYGVLRSVHQAC